MFKKLLFIASLALFPVIGMAQSTPDGVVRAFYTWYISYPFPGRPLTDDRITEFVESITINKIKAAYVAEYVGSDWFTRSQDWDEKDWLKTMTVSKPLYSDNKAIVTIRMGSYQGMKNHLIVVLKKVGEVWKIIEIVDANDHD